MEIEAAEVTTGSFVVVYFMIFMAICVFGFLFVVIAVPIAWRHEKRMRMRNPSPRLHEPIEIGYRPNKGTKPMPRWMPYNTTPQSHLEHLTMQELHKRYPDTPAPFSPPSNRRDDGQGD